MKVGWAWPWTKFSYCYDVMIQAIFLNAAEKKKKKKKKKKTKKKKKKKKKKNSE